MTNQEFKLLVLHTLKNRKVFTEAVSNFEIRTRCPFCGDSQKNLMTGHFYLRINPNDNYPILYNCFKCPAQGVLKYNDLELLGIVGDSFKSGITTLNKTSDKVSSQESFISDIRFEYELPTKYSYRKIDYIENRLGLHFTDEQLQKMKVITSLKDFLILNQIPTITCKPNMANYLEANYIGFLSYNNSHILFRDTTESSDIRWYKYPITIASVGQRIFYTMESSVDLYTPDDITINLAEGVLDIVSICHNLGYDNKDNVLNIAVCGKYYNSILKYLYGMGFVGSNITVNIFADNDHTKDTSVEHYQEILKDYSYFVNKINLFYNLKKKDCGVKKEDIMLQKYTI